MKTKWDKVSLLLDNDNSYIQGYWAEKNLPIEKLDYSGKCACHALSIRLPAILHNKSITR